MMKIKAHMVITIMLMVLASCQSAPAGNKLPIPTPAEGKVTVTGRILSSTTKKPIGNTVVRLPEVVRQNGQAVFVLDQAFSPGTYTNADGYFVITGIDPKEYMLVVGIVPDNYKVYADNSGKGITWNTTAGKITDFGDISIDYQPGVIIPPTLTPTP